MAGVIARGGARVPRDIVAGLTAAIAHRGPDGAGVWCGDIVGLGHGRLAIIDPSAAAAQPMISADSRFVLTYNGEVYNFRELRTELEALGRRFRSRSDTEVVLQALAQWGTGAIARFNGLFALALWDSERRELLLARDRYGAKPLYYAKCGGKLIFGSEVKAILQHPDYRVQMDLEALLEYFTFQNFFTDRTLFKGGRRLPAGCWLKLSAQGGERLFRYLDFDFREPQYPLADAEYLEADARLMRQALSLQPVRDVDMRSP